MPSRGQIEAAALCMEHLCDHDWHGYTQAGGTPGRWGDGEGTCPVDTPIGTCYVEQGDRDCSSAVISSYEAAGIDCGGATYTGNMYDCMVGTGNFRGHWMSDGYNCDDGYVAKRGDCYLNTECHTAMCTSQIPDLLAEFSIAEDGSIYGRTGDQTGLESVSGRPYYGFPWNYVLECIVTDDPQPEPKPEPEPEPEYRQYVIDVSEHNGEIDWQAVKDAGWHAIIRVGYGDNLEEQDDDYYWRNISECERLGIPHGVYIYSYAYSTEQAMSEAEHVLRLIDGKELQYPVYWDSEEPGTESVAAENARVFLNRIEAAGYWAGIYSSESWFNAYLHGFWDRWTPWVAKWGSNDGTPQEPPYCPYDMWQYSSEGDVPGVGGRCDVSLSVRNFPKEISGDPTPPSPQPTPTPSGAPEKIRYAVKTAEDGWLPFVTDLEDYAGIQGHAATYLAIDMNGHGWYQVKSQASGWLPAVSGCNIDDYEYGCAGDGSPITAVRVYYETQNPSQTGWWKAKYRTSNIWSNYYPWQYDDETSNGQDGYAGDGWNAIDRVQITLSR